MRLQFDLTPDDVEVAVAGSPPIADLLAIATQRAHITRATLTVTIELNAAAAKREAAEAAGQQRLSTKQMLQEDLKHPSTEDIPAGAAERRAPERAAQTAHLTPDGKLKPRKRP
jgi:hypothetical protein